MNKIKKVNVNGQIYDIGEDTAYQLLYINDFRDESEYTKISEFITRLAKANQRGLIRFNKNNSNNKSYAFTADFYEIAPVSNKVIYANPIQWRYEITAVAQFEGTWENDVFTLSSIKNSMTGYYPYALATNNTFRYTPTSDYHPSTKLYVDTKFAEALAMGFKVEVVEALPTENISHQTIYLMLSSSQAESNIYDEYIYTSDNEWEKIGSTSTSFDLSNYYNKQEVDEKIEEHDLGYFNVFVPEIIDGGQDKSGETYAILKDFFENVYDSSKKVHITDGKKHFYFIETSNSSSLLLFSHLGFGITTANTSNGNSQKSFTDYYLLYVSKSNGEITSIEFRNQSTAYPVRPVTTQESHNITHKYNLANKSYADMASEYDCEYYGIKIWATSQTYEVGEIIYNPANEKFYKVIKRMFHRTSITSAYAEELTEEEIEMLRRPKKEVVQAEFDDLVKDITSDGVEYVVETKEIPINYEVINLSADYGFELSEDNYYQNNNQGVSNNWAMCKVIFNNDFDIELTIDYIGDGYSAFNYGVLGQLDVELGKNTNFDGDNNSTKVKRTSRDDNSSDVRQVKYLIPAGEHFICAKYVRTTATIGSGTDTFKFKFNTTVSQEVIDKFYVADKKYVDDQVGTINTILATLTTVEEGE